jgi:hypothetical protein
MRRLRQCDSNVEQNQKRIRTPAIALSKVSVRRQRKESHRHAKLEA